MDIDIKDPYYSLKHEIVQALYVVEDPELGINIIDLGLVYGIEIGEANKTIRIEMTLSTPSCPLGGLISSHVKVATETIKPDYSAIVEIVWEPRWNADRISEKGRELLGW